MTPEDFDALFDSITVSAFRYEGLPVYEVDEEDADLAAWRDGRPVAERSVRTDPWLARIARQTIVDGVSWCRVRLATSPLSWYLRWEIADGYLESQAAGERILLTDRAVWDGPDFWLLDAKTPQARAVLLRYDGNGVSTGYDMITDVEALDALTTVAVAAVMSATPLNVWLVEHRDELAGVVG